MVRVMHFRTCDDCGEEWNVSPKIAALHADEVWFCQDCEATAEADCAEYAAENRACVPDNDVRYGTWGD